ncbi:MAG: site-2 protease family protein, partial [Firmicutes bacterium]|nr:site-2 protease family protein [Bacillota bacterium]
MARWLGYEVEAIALLPFGGVAELRTGQLGFRPRDETLIAMGGPLVNLLLMLAALSIHLAGVIDERDAMVFATMNLTLFFFNLLPGLPLDGGRIARAGMAQSRGYHDATKGVLRMSFFLSATLMVLGSLSLLFGFADDGLLLLGLFLLVSAYTTARQTRYDVLRFLDAKRRERLTSPQPLTTLIVNGDTPIGDVARRL